MALIKGLTASEWARLRVDVSETASLQQCRQALAGGTAGVEDFIRRALETSKHATFHVVIIEHVTRRLLERCEPGGE